MKTAIIKVLKIFILTGSFAFWSACGSGPSEPPRPPVVEAVPTVVPATTTPVPTPTVTVPQKTEAEPTATAEPAPQEPPATIPAEVSPLPVEPLPPQPAETVPPQEEVEPDSPVPATVAPAVVEVAPLPTEPSPAAPLPPLAELKLRFVPVAGGFTKPLFLTHAGDGSGRLFVVEQAGRVWIVQNGAVNPTPFLDIVPLVGSGGSEQGLLSLAFHPDTRNNGYLYVNYTDPQGDTVIARYQVSSDPNRVDPNSAKTLLTFDQPYGNHNGGLILFGPDNYLYVGTGDGGSANDPHNNGQSLNTLLGKILRLDVDGADPYGVPSSNPYVSQSQARPEIWSYGWRNPWRFSFDRQTGDMYVGDVGQNQYEEVSFEPAGAAGGQNYGWRLMEGNHCFDPAECDPAGQGLILPIAEYDHGLGCSVTGGYVYRGSQFPALQGLYLYGDFCTGIVWGLRREADGSWAQAELLRSGYNISSFGEDEAGELYLVHHGGDIFRVESD